MSPPSTSSPSTPPPRPTDAELEILRVLWQRGPSTVRVVHEALTGTGDGKAVRYTTTLKQLQVMTDKALVRRDESSRSHVYEAAVGEAETQGALLEHLLKSAFGGSAQKLFLRALSRKAASAEELDELRRLLDEQERGDGER